MIIRFQLYHYLHPSFVMTVKGNPGTPHNIAEFRLLKATLDKIFLRDDLIIFQIKNPIQIVNFNLFSWGDGKDLRRKITFNGCTVFDFLFTYWANSFFNRKILSTNSHFEKKYFSTTNGLIKILQTTRYCFLKAIAISIIAFQHW